MAKMTLLEIVKDILTDMNSDKVNSIDDTTESEDVAQIVKTCYFEMIGHRNWPHLKKLITFESVGLTAHPTKLKIPENVKEISGKVSYDNIDAIAGKPYSPTEMTYKEPEDFLSTAQQIKYGTADTLMVEEPSGAKFFVYTNRQPTYWTSFDNKYIVCDAVSLTAGSTLMGSRAQAMAYVDPEWQHLDDFIPDLPSEAFPALLEEAKSTAFIVVKQVANQKAEQKAVRQQKWLSRKAWTAKGGVRYNSYGRIGRK